MSEVEILLAHPPYFLAEEIVKLRARVAELEAGIEKMPCDYKRDGDDLDHSESCRKCALLNRN